MPQTRSQTTYIPAHAIPARAVEVAGQVDAAIAASAEGRDVTSVLVTPLATGLSDGESPTAGVLVTVVWREG
jgi:hypothetical protein